MRITERKYETEFHNRVEELTGTYPSADTLRNAVFAILDAGRSAVHGPESRSEHDSVDARLVLESVEIFARKYETTRGIHFHLPRHVAGGRRILTYISWDAS